MAGTGAVLYTNVGTPAAPNYVEVPTLLDGSLHRLPVAASVSNFPATQAVSGTVTVGNFPATQPISGAVSVNNFPATQPVSGTVAVNNFPATQPVSGAVSVSNFPATQVVSVANTVSVASHPVTFASAQPVNVQNLPATQAVSGTVAVSNFPATQPVSGSVSVTNFPATQPVSGAVTVSGSVSVSNLPATQNVSLVGSTNNVVVSNFPATQPVSGTVAVNNFPASQNVSFNNVAQPVSLSGTSNAVNVQNFPANQAVNFAGAAQPVSFPSTQPVNVQNLPATQNVSFNSVTQPVAVQNFPTVQQVCGALAINNRPYAPARLYKQALLLNGTGAQSMLVDGSATAKVFKVGADATLATSVTQLLIVASGSSLYPRGSYFGGGNQPLSNGILITATSGSTTTTLATLKVNEDFLTLDDCHIDVSGTYDFLRATLAFQLTLTAGSADNLTVTIRDNMNATGGLLGATSIGLTALCMYAVGSKP